MIAAEPAYGPNGRLALAEKRRVEAISERDAEMRETDRRRARHGYTEPPAAPRHAIAIDREKPAEKRRYRALPADHPLVRAWVKGKIDEFQFGAGNVYRVVYEKANDPHGRDSTQGIAVDRSRSGDGVGTAARDLIDARKSLARVEKSLGSVDRIIVRRFCGQGQSMSAAVYAATECATNGVLFRVREALQSLVPIINRGGFTDEKAAFKDVT